jgi:hypothetical protein
MTTENTSSNISQPYIDANIIKLRLDTEALLHKIEIYLKGEKEDYYEDAKTNDIKVRTIKLSLRKANFEGIQSIYNWAAGVLNPQVSQGNFQVDKEAFCKKYEDYIFYYRIDLSTMLMNNITEYGIADNDYEGIIDYVMNIITPFMTRLIDNKEREGLGQIKAEQRSIVEKDAKKFGIW